MYLMLGWLLKEFGADLASLGSVSVGILILLWSIICNSMLYVIRIFMLPVVNRVELTDICVDLQAVILSW